ncbi:unnamed protein product [Victoria cruziana]
MSCFYLTKEEIPILKEEIDDPKFFYLTQKLFFAGRLVGGEKGSCSVPHNLDQEIGRIRQKHEIPIVQRIRSVLLRTCHIDDQSNSGEEAFAFCWVKSIQRKAAFHSLVSSWHTPPQPSSLLCATFLIEAAGLTPKAEFYGRERCNNNNGAMRDLIKYCKRRGLLIELGREAILVLRSERCLAHKQAPLNYPYLIRICYTRYADDSLLGIVGAIELIIEIQKCITHFLQSGLNLGVVSAGSTTIAARSTVEFPGTVIQEVPPRTTPIPFLRELEKRLWVKHRIHITACHLRSAIHSKLRDLGFSIPIQQLTKGMSGTGSLLDAVQLAETLGTTGVRSQKVSVCCVKHIRQGSREIEFLHSPGQSNVPSDVQQAVSRSGMSVRKFSLDTPAGQKAAGEGGGHWVGSFHSKFPIRIEARRRPWPTHVAYLTNVSDGDIVNRSAGIAISPLSYYRCHDNLYQVRTIVDYQIPQILGAEYNPKVSHIVNQEGGHTLAEFPNSIELGKLRPGQDPNNKEHSTTIRQSIGVTSSSCIF